MCRQFVHLVTIFVMLTCALFGATWQLKPEDAVILLSDNGSVVHAFAAKELQKHLGLICGVEIPIRDRQDDARYAFYINAWPVGADFMLAPEEGRWWVNEGIVWLYGEDSESTPRPADQEVSIRSVARQRRTGTLNAVYDFLEKQFGVLWIEPGDHGISHPVTPGVLTLTTGEGQWKPNQLIKRGLRSGLPSRLTDYNKDLPEPFQLTEEQFRQKHDEVNLWLKRMRMGTSLELHYGHAFTQWWKKYGPNTRSTSHSSRANAPQHGQQCQKPSKCAPAALACISRSSTTGSPKPHDQNASTHAKTIGATTASAMPAESSTCRRCQERSGTTT